MQYLLWRKRHNISISEPPNSEGALAPPVPPLNTALLRSSDHKRNMSVKDKNKYLIGEIWL